MANVYCYFCHFFLSAAFKVPAKMLFIPEMVQADDLLIANSLSSTTGMIALVLGALAGGVLIVEQGAGSFGGFCCGVVCYFSFRSFYFLHHQITPQIACKSRFHRRHQGK